MNFTTFTILNYFLSCINYLIYCYNINCDETVKNYFLLLSPNLLEIFLDVEYFIVLNIPIEIYLSLLKNSKYFLTYHGLVDLLCYLLIGNV
jgi:hypothetical protein